MNTPGVSYSAEVLLSFRTLLVHVQVSLKITFFLFLGVLGVLVIITPVVASSPERIVSLAPNVTETLYALDLGDRVVAVSRQCNYPREVKKKPRIGDMVNPSLELIMSFKPDVVVLTDDGNPKVIWDRLRELKIFTYVYRPRRLQELPGEIVKLGRVLDVPDKAEKIARHIEATLKFYGERKKGKERKALFILQVNPLVVAGTHTAIDDIFSLLGLKNAAGELPLSYPTLSREKMVSLNPEIIFVGHDSSRQEIMKWKEVRAVQRGYVFQMSESLFRMSPRLMNGIGEMAQFIQSLP
jgi:iron complex transport system substrate-binding protein